MNLFVLSGHREITMRFRLKLRYLVICVVVTVAVITSAFLYYHFSQERGLGLTSSALTIQTNSFCFWEKYQCFFVSDIRLVVLHTAIGII